MVVFDCGRLELQADKKDLQKTASGPTMACVSYMRIVVRVS